MGSLGSKWRKLGAVARSSSIRWLRRGTNPTFVRPCYWLAQNLQPGDVIADCGLGHDADFSVELIRRFGVVSHGFDPTRRHGPMLQNLEALFKGQFFYTQAAVGGCAGRVTFHESLTNVSGSMEVGHTNIEHDAVTSYPVDVVTLEDVIRGVGRSLALVKLDVEGSEYDALTLASDHTLTLVPQWIVEFHHDVVRARHFYETRKLAKRFRVLGFQEFTTDAVNFLFYLPDGRTRKR